MILKKVVPVRVTMRQNKAQKIEGLSESIEATVVCFSLMARLENLDRLGYFVSKEKQIAKNTIRNLRTKERLIEGLDEGLGIDKVDPMMANFDNFVQAVAKVPPLYMEEFVEVVENFLETKKK